MGMRERIREEIRDWDGGSASDSSAKELADAILKVIEEELLEEKEKWPSGSTGNLYINGFNDCLAALKEKLKEK